MKKILFTLLLLGLLPLMAAAQKLSYNYKSVTASGPSSFERLTAKIYVTNNSSDPADSVIMWEVYNKTVPASWELQFCDAKDCYINPTGSRSYVQKPTQLREFKADFVLNSNSGNGEILILVWLENDPANVDTLGFSAATWATGVATETTQDAVLYPNPSADGQVTLKTGWNGTYEVEVYALNGSLVLSTTNSDESLLNLQQLEAGTYIVLAKQGDHTTYRKLTLLN